MEFDKPNSPEPTSKTQTRAWYPPDIECAAGPHDPIDFDSTANYRGMTKATVGDTRRQWWGENAVHHLCTRSCDRGRPTQPLRSQAGTGPGRDPCQPTQGRRAVAPAARWLRTLGHGPPGAPPANHRRVHPGDHNGAAAVARRGRSRRRRSPTARGRAALRQWSIPKHREVSRDRLEGVSALSSGSRRMLTGSGSGCSRPAPVALVGVAPLPRTG